MKLETGTLLGLRLQNVKVSYAKSEACRLHMNSKAGFAVEERHVAIILLNYHFLLGQGWSFFMQINMCIYQARVGIKSRE
jgi:hypothetical protein